MEELKELVFYLRQLNMASLLARFALAVICGGLIGADRGKKHQAAGLRTHLLVCIGAASVMITNQYICSFLSPGTDMSRMGAQVVSGVGFLAVGTIIVTGHRHVKGLTTAAGLWASACMGLVIGIGYYECAIIMCAVLLLVLQAMNRLDARYIKSTKISVLYLEHDERFRLSYAINVIRECGYTFSGVEYITNSRNGYGSMQITVERPVNTDRPIFEMLHAVEGVLFIEEF